MIYTVVNKFVFIDFVGYLYYSPLPGSAGATVSGAVEGPVVDAILVQFYPALVPCSGAGLRPASNSPVGVNEEW
jgi:hypothetical protein